MHLLDPGGMDPAVLDQLGQRDPRGLPADRVEAGQQHRLRGVVDHHVDPGHLLEGPDVAALPADDPALHVVPGQVHGGHHRLRRLLRGDPLDGADDDHLGPRVGLARRLALDVAGDQHRLALGVVLDDGDQLGLGLLGRQPGEALQDLLLLGLALGQRSPLGLQLRLELVELMGRLSSLRVSASNRSSRSESRCSRRSRSARCSRSSARCWSRLVGRLGPGRLRRRHDCVGLAAKLARSRSGCAPMAGSRRAAVTPTAPAAAAARRDRPSSAGEAADRPPCRSGTVRAAPSRPCRRSRRPRAGRDRQRPASGKRHPPRRAPVPHARGVLSPGPATHLDERLRRERAIAGAEREHHPRLSGETRSNSHRNPER